MRLLENLVWAADILGEAESRNEALKLLRNLSRRTGAIIQPVYLLTQGRAQDARIYALAEKQMSDLVMASDIPTMRPGTILIENENSNRQAVRRIVEFAINKNASAIVVSTHGRKGLPRLFLGSFAETLLLQSSLPVLTVNPSTHASQEISHILVPTDFSQPSRRGFESTVEFAKQWGARVTLYYKEPPIVVSPYVGVPVMVYEYSEEETKSRKACAQAWADWGRHRGITVEIQMDETPGVVASSISKFAADQNVDLISIIGQSGPVSSVILGSVTRQVIREAFCPVWVRHV